ncbi:PfkB family carbohydrate kinase [uncultured Ruminococcus sp.]|uniref:PfkB family carbohydrate kinase n=1 Tax=uncultured Ruminococcus sp. TaxID=165186 RepID=UPI0025FC0E45|nr:PfkB family carbohydrate kinase [uncultured Ruminococcus sp.]
MNKIKLTALPCICADVFYGTEIIRPGGEALNFAAHASYFKDIDVTLLGVVGKDKYAEAIMDSISKLDIDKNHIRIDERYQTANNMTYLTESGDRYYKDDSWNGEILDNIVLNDNEIKILSRSDVVFVHFWASCFSQVVELKETLGFKLAVDFDVYRDFADMERFAPHVDFFMISGSEEFLPRFKELSNKYRCLFNVSLAERGSVTYFNGQEFKVQAAKVESIIDTTGCGDSYHAGFVCSYMLENNIEKAMNVGSEIAAETLKHYGGF